MGGEEGLISADAHLIRNQQLEPHLLRHKLGRRFVVDPKITIHWRESQEERKTFESTQGMLLAEGVDVISVVMVVAQVYSEVNYLLRNS